ncbi:hypothetical protein [Paenibacillus sanfengchensis]
MPRRVVIPDAFDPCNLCQPDRLNAAVPQFLEGKRVVRPLTTYREVANK